MRRSPRTLLLVVLGIALVAVVVADVVRESAPPPAPEPRTRPADAPPTTLQEVALQVGGSREQTVRARVGQPLRLTVEGVARADVVAIPDLGQTAPISEDLPAVFSLLPSRTGTFRIELLGTDRGVGALRVTE